MNPKTILIGTTVGTVISIVNLLAIVAIWSGIDYKPSSSTAIYVTWAVTIISVYGNLLAMVENE